MSVVIEADGGSRGNPGVAGYGALVRHEGRLVAERAEPLGQASNNVAEYSGLIAGLKAVIDLGLAAEAVEVCMDSKLVIEQMAGRWKIKHEDMRRLAAEAAGLVRAIHAEGGSITWTWVPRAQNKDADALSNDAMDGNSIHRDHVGAGNPVEPAGQSGASREGAVAMGATVLTGVDSGSASDVDGSGANADMEPPTRIVLVRHGVTDYTTAQRMDGRGGANPPLNDHGLAQAEAAAEGVAALVSRMPDERVTIVTSSLRRAQQTGAAIATRLGLQHEVDADWDERAFGEWDGASVPELVAEHGEKLRHLRDDADFACPGGETQAAMAERVSNAFARAVSRSGIVVVATHRTPIMAVLGETLGIDYGRQWLLGAAPASITTLEVWRDGGRWVTCVNDTHHLRGLA